MKLEDNAGELSHSQKNGPTVCRTFRRLHLENQALKASCQKENKPERESLLSLQSLPAQEAEGLEGLLNIYRCWKTVPKVQDFEAYQKQKKAYRKQKVPQEYALKEKMSRLRTYSLVPSLFSRLSSFFGRLQNPVLLVLSSKNGRFRRPSKPSAF